MTLAEEIAPNSTTKDLRVGVIGTGMIGRDHTRRLQQVLSGVKVVALSDYSPDAACAVRADLTPEATVFEKGEDLGRLRRGRCRSCLLHRVYA